MFWRLRGLKDTQCGVKVFSKDLIDTINGDFLIADFAFDVNLVYSAVRHGFKVKEVGITWVEKDGGNVSRELLKHSFIMAFSLLRLRIYYSPFKGILNSQPFRKIANLFYRG
jgi:hypothetical protein